MRGSQSPVVSIFVPVVSRYWTRRESEDPDRLHNLTTNSPNAIPLFVTTETISHQTLGSGVEPSASCNCPSYIVLRPSVPEDLTVGCKLIPVALGSNAPYHDTDVLVDLTHTDTITYVGLTDSILGSNWTITTRGPRLGSVCSAAV